MWPLSFSFYNWNSNRRWYYCFVELQWHIDYGFWDTVLGGHSLPPRHWSDSKSPGKFPKEVLSILAQKLGAKSHCKSEWIYLWLNFMLTPSELGVLKHSMPGGCRPLLSLLFLEVWQSNWSQRFFIIQTMSFWNKSLIRMLLLLLEHNYYHGVIWLIKIESVLKACGTLPSVKKWSI